MSDKTKKALLNEQATKRFWKLAGLKPIHEKAYVFEEEEIEENEDLEERAMMRRSKEDEDKKVDESEDLEEGGVMPRAAEDEMEDDAEDEMAMDADAEDPAGDMEDIEVDVPEGDVASLRTARDILDQILSAVEGGDDAPADEEDPADELEGELSEELDADDGLNEVDQEELEEVAERIAARVAKRITESLKLKNK